MDRKEDAFDWQLRDERLTSRRPSDFPGGREVDVNEQDELTPVWTTAKSAELYQVRGWGEPYFSISERGTLEVRPDPEKPTRSIDLHELVQDLEARGLDLPL